MEVFSLLYAVRKPSHTYPGCELKFPPRYSHKSSKNDGDMMVYEVANCFSLGSGELPRLFPEIEIICGTSGNVYVAASAVTHTHTHRTTLNPCTCMDGFGTFTPGYLADNHLIVRTESSYMIDSYLTPNHSKNSTLSCIASHSVNTSHKIINFASTCI